MPEGTTNDPIADITRLAASGIRVRLAPGVIGRSSVLNASLVGVWALVLWRLSPSAPWWYNVALFAGASIISAFIARQLRHMREFATRNPGLALTEGAELVQYMLAEAQAKGQLKGDASPAIATPGTPFPVDLTHSQEPPE